jgi:hypothetical protein
MYNQSDCIVVDIAGDSTGRKWMGKESVVTFVGIPEGAELAKW